MTGPRLCPQDQPQRDLWQESVGLRGVEACGAGEGRTHRLDKRETASGPLRLVLRTQPRSRMASPDLICGINGSEFVKNFTKFLARAGASGVWVSQRSGACIRIMILFRT